MRPTQFHWGGSNSLNIPKGRGRGGREKLALSRFKCAVASIADHCQVDQRSLLWVDTREMQNFSGAIRSLLMSVLELLFGAIWSLLGAQRVLFEPLRRLEVSFGLNQGRLKIKPIAKNLNYHALHSISQPQHCLALLLVCCMSNVYSKFISLVVVFPVNVFQQFSLICLASTGPLKAKIEFPILC